MTMAFFLFIGLTVGWMILELLALIFIHYSETTKKESVWRFVTFMRFFSILLIIWVIIFNYISIWQYNEIAMYVIPIVIVLLVGVIYFKGGLEAAILKMRRFKGIRFSDDCSMMFIPFSILLYIFTIAGLLIVFIWYYFNGASTGVLWVKSFVDTTLLQFLVNPFMCTLLIIFLIFTIFYPFIQLIYILFKYGSYQILSDKVKRGIYITRMWALVFLIVTVFLKYILSLAYILPTWSMWVISLGATIIYGYLAYKARVLVFH